MTDETTNTANQPKVFTIDSIADIVEFQLTYRAYAQPFSFKMKTELDEDRAARAEKKIGKTKEEKLQIQHEENAQNLADLLIEAPAGFGDFPTDQVLAEGVTARALNERAYAYFSNPKLKKIVSDILVAYAQATRPLEFFR